MTKNKSKIPFPFSPENFRKEGHNLVDILSDYLEKALSGADMPVLPGNDPDSLTEYFSLDSAGSDKESLDAFIKRIIDNSIHIHHPHYIGHQVTSPSRYCSGTILYNSS
jgi:L-2,4-diaminobutyrate decarboxylase